AVRRHGRRAGVQGDRRGDAEIPPRGAVDAVADHRSRRAAVGRILATVSAAACRRPRRARPRCTGRNLAGRRRRSAGAGGGERRRPITNTGAGSGLAIESCFDTRLRGGRAMKLRDLLRDVAVHGDVDDVEITGVTSDSRLVKPGALFVAIPGTAMDGAKFVPQAIEKGAVAIVGLPVDGDQLPGNRQPATSNSYIAVDDPRAALAVIAANFYGRPADKLALVGVTGTSGKTTTTKMIESIFDAPAKGVVE